MDNRDIARHLDEVADLLAGQGANPFRVAAYRRAALRGLDPSAQEVWRTGGRDGLKHLLGIGASLAGSIEELITTGRLAFLDRLQDQADPEALLAGVPGSGPPRRRRRRGAAP